MQNESKGKSTKRVDVRRKEPWENGRTDGANDKTHQTQQAFFFFFPPVSSSEG